MIFLEHAAFPETRVQRLPGQSIRAGTLDQVLNVSPMGAGAMMSTYFFNAAPFTFHSASSIDDPLLDLHENRSLVVCVEHRTWTFQETLVERLPGQIIRADTPDQVLNARPRPIEYVASMSTDRHNGALGTFHWAVPVAPIDLHCGTGVSPQHLLTSAYHMQCEFPPLVARRQIQDEHVVRFDLFWFFEAHEPQLLIKTLCGQKALLARDAHLRPRV